MKHDPIEFVGHLLRPFFRWWFAALTVLLSLVALVVTPDAGWRLSGPWALGLCVFACTSFFLVASMLVQGWSLWRESFPHLEVTSVQREGPEAGGWQFVLAGRVPDAVGTLVDVHRKLGEAELPFALLEIVSITSAGHYQARTLSTSAAHVRDYAQGSFTTSEMVARPQVRASRIRDSLNDLAESGVAR